MRVRYRGDGRKLPVIRGQGSGLFQGETTGLQLIDIGHHGAGMLLRQVKGRPLVPQQHDNMTSALTQNRGFSLKQYIPYFTLRSTC